MKELIKKIKNGKSPIPKVLATTGFSEHSTQEIIEAGAIGVYEKPQDMNDLISAVKDICK